VSLAVLSVAYPFAPVGPDTAGGAEQVLAAIDAGLTRAGHRSLVLGQEGSRVAGELVPLPRLAGALDEGRRSALHAVVRERLDALLASQAIDVVHYHGVDFPAYAARSQTPAVATLHLPPSWYPPATFGPDGPWLVPVSASQAGACPPSPRLLPPVENCVPVEALQSLRLTRRGFALVLARLCPEKGIHLALQAAHRAGVSLLVAGELFAYPDHVRYVEREVTPLLDARRRVLGSVGFARKRRLLAAARCLLVPALVDETSSLVAREAMACGTPVIAFPRGALPEVVSEGRTGFLVEDVAGMADAIAAVGRLDPEVAREEARRRFRQETMVARYLALYADLARGGRRVRRAS
jgi:glycosyltransferase involved in cell wall biosynthesis